MEVRCSNCSTEYEFDDALVSARGTSVKCTACGHQFRVHAPPAVTGISEKWIVRDARGKETAYTSLRELQQAIVRGLLDPKHEMSHGNQAFRPLQDIYELQTFFDVARQRVLNQRQPPRTLLGVGRDAAKPSRQSVPPPRKARPDPSSPVQDRITPVAGVPAMNPPARGPMDTEDNVRVPTETGARPMLRGNNAALPGMASPLTATPDRASRPPPYEPRERISQNPLEPPVIQASAAQAVPWQHLQGLQDEPASNPMAPSRGAGSRWIVAVLFLGTLGLLGATVGREYLVRFIHREPPAPVVDQRVPALLEQARVALARGDFESANSELSKASVLAEADPAVASARARLEVARTEPVWLRLKIMAALEAAAAQKAQTQTQTRRRKPTAAEAAAEADLAAKDALEKKQLELSFQDRIAQVKASVSSAMMRAPNSLEAVRAKLDSLRLANLVKDARALVGPVANAGSDPENAYTLGALDLAESDAGLPSALDRLRTAARTEEALGKARALLIYALAQSGDAAGASAELGKLQTIAPQHPALGALRSLVELAQSKVAAAPAPAPAPVAAQEPDSARAAASYPPTPKPAGEDLKSLLSQAGALHREGDLEGAEKLYQSVLARSPKNLDALSGLGDIARQRHQSATAAAFYDQALKQNRNHVPTLMARADLYWAAGNRILAVALYRRALSQVSPSAPVGQRALQRIEEFDRDGAGTTAPENAGEPAPSEPALKEPASDTPAPPPAPATDATESAPARRRLPPIGGVSTNGAPAPIAPTPVKPVPLPAKPAPSAPGEVSDPSPPSGTSPP